MEIETKVLLLAIYKQPDLSLNDVLLQLEESGVFTLKNGKIRLKELKNENFISDSKLTVTGIAEAKEVENGFKLQ